MMGDPNFSNVETEERKLIRFYDIFCITATLQGRVAYFLMSFHAVAPWICKSVTNYDPTNILFVNMVYGIGFMIYCRPSMRSISKFNRASFSILGSLMFNHSSMLFYNWLINNWSHRPYLLTLMGFIGGRIMLIHLLAYLYHVDSRYRGFHIRLSPEFEAMYRQPH